ncbi:MAG: hypothetical protein IPJ65_18390 [Archangiaceae bacterium]|nr:hypothetical protein [Archangiaceae bacterium]
MASARDSASSRHWSAGEVRVRRRGGPEGDVSSSEPWQPAAEHSMRVTAVEAASGPNGDWPRRAVTLPIIHSASGHCGGAECCRVTRAGVAATATAMIAASIWVTVQQIHPGMKPEVTAKVAR